MITKAVLHMGLRAEDARLCQLGSLSAVQAMVPLLTSQLVTLDALQGRGVAKLCPECRDCYWFAYETSGEEH